MRKLVSLLLIIGGCGILLYVLLSLLRLKDAAIIVEYIGLSMLMAGVVISLFSYKEIAQRWVLYGKRFQGLITAFSIMLYIGILILLISVFLKSWHWQGVKQLLIIATSLILISYGSIAYLSFNRKKYLPEMADQIQVFDLEQYAGVYINEQLSLEIRVMIDGDRLVAQLKGQPSFPLFAVEKDIFNFTPAGVVIEFHLDKGEFILIQHGRYLAFKKQ